MTIQLCRTPFPIFHCLLFVSGSNCCFLTCILVYQAAGQMVWYSHLFKNFPVCCDPQRFSVVNEAEVDFFFFFFWNSLAFSMIQCMLAVWSLVPLPFLNLACLSGNSQFTYSWSLAWRILNITLPTCEMTTIYSSLNILWHCLSLELECKLTFSSPVATAEFSRLAGILSTTL